MDPIPFRLDVAATPRDPRADVAASPTVLIVDDSRFVRASLVRGLASRFRLQQAESGERAWELLLLDASIGAVLSDLTMPGMDGFELLRRVRASMLDRVRALPFAVLSGADDAAQRARAEALGADRFVVKGDGVDALADWIAERLSAAQTPAPAAVASPSAATDAPACADAPADIDVPVGGEMPAIAAANVAVGAPVAAESVTPSDTPPASTASPTAPGPTRTPDPLERWFRAAASRPAAAGEAPPALLRLHAPGLGELHARLRRGVRAADALHLDDADLAWLCVPASGPLALRLAVRFGLLAAGRLATASGAAARVSVCLVGVDPARRSETLEALRALPLEAPPAPGLAMRAVAGPWGPAWQCTLPWPAARLLVCA
ncbi:MAG: response regulator [Burkholderiales bacterium]|nr:response regulator [Burkholderiales bacterium]